jgi:hypothetical protein
MKEGPGFANTCAVADYKKQKTMKGLVTSSHYEGLTLEQANEKARLNGLTPRVVEIDGKSLMLTMELMNHRVNFRVRNGLVIEAWAG